jgi:hypothetical protein
VHKLDPGHWPDEDDVIARVRDGVEADFTGRAPTDAPWQGARIRAGLLRALYFGLAIDDPAHVDAEGARFPPMAVALTRRGMPPLGGMPRPRTRNCRPDWVPGGMRTVTGCRSMPGSSTSPPSAAVVKGTGTTANSVVPSRWNNACGFRWTKM